VTDIDITPELLRDVADWLNKRGLYAGVARIRSEADNLEREQADEKRIDELLQVFWAARGTRHHVEDADRTAMRAVLAKLERDDLITNPLEAAEYQEKVLGITQEQCAAEAKAGTFLASYEVAPRPQNGYGDPGADPADEWDRKPRRWNDLRAVPADVKRVRDRTGGYFLRRDDHGNEWQREYANGNRGPFAASKASSNFSPYTEIVERRP